MVIIMFDELEEVKYFKELNKFQESLLWCKILERNKTLKKFSKSRVVFRTQASIRDGAFLWIYLRLTIFAIKAPSQMLYIDLRKYWNLQSQAKLEQIVAIVTTHNVFLLIFKSWPLIKQNKIGKQTYKVDFSVFLATSNNCNNNKRGEWNRIHLETYLQKTAKNGPERYLSFGPNHILVTLKWDDGRSSVYENVCWWFFSKELTLALS